MIVTYTPHEVESFWRQVFQTYYVRVQESDMLYPDVKSVVFTWSELCSISMNIADWICDNAMECIPIGERLLRETFFTETQIQSNDDPVCIRIIELPKDKRVPISKLKYHFNRKMISVSGMVRKLSKSDTYMSAAFFQCSLCNHSWVEKQDSIYLKRPNICPSCQKGAFKAIVNNRVLSTYRDYQDGELQESPEGLTGGKQPQSVQFCLKGDLTSKLTVGAKVILNGILRMEDKKESDDCTITSFVLEVNSIEAEDEDMDEVQLTEEDIEEVKELSQSPHIIQDLAQSIAPSIYGFESVKVALALQLAGGTQIHAGDGTTKRGDIHILLIGDPGTAKSQMLKSVSEIASRKIMTSGKSASAAGLTATAAKQADGRWTVEAGALVLADGGIVCVDELDKMREDDRAGLHSAMEDQHIYFAKAGLTMTLRTKCSILAAANPKYGRFDDNDTYTNQIDLPPSLISRFDLIFVITDIPDFEKDTAICNHILAEHTLGQINEATEYNGSMNLEMMSKDLATVNPKVPLPLMKKYIAYARKLKPVMTPEAEDVLRSSFTSIRGKYNNNDKAIPITFRQMDGYIRLATASAKLHLRQDITPEDANLAVGIIEHYLDSIANCDGVSDIDAVMTSVQKKDREIMALIDLYFDENGGGLQNQEEIVAALAGEGCSEAQVISAIRKMRSMKWLFKPSDAPDGYYARAGRSKK